MKTIAKVIESMLAQDATRPWSAKAVSESGVTSTWGWGGYASTWGWGGFSGDSTPVA